ncbi:DUF4912 domain-containing protein [cyanobacterium endosymbiont of Epithemia clementina EcSB]|uniref:DUF4912 domain-containing protein n=1 Tax=cyanobacterium endosymbiont of Epithemia clementina EcSB TaxID=3034674 RepID=UPI002480F5F0|nr:DUF4912 domain-containing protein [cyanobacterium endosymbiont of Epithemia clementina EcSB]WGT67889.1 DUF4912 domain-containing protein [cyanobacterium endosymbiont of Epithemia clementina EcSB]
MVQEQLLLEKMTLRRLRRVASEYNISLYSRMGKAQLLSAIKQLIQEQTVQKPKIKEMTRSPKLVQEEQEMETSKFEVDQDDIVEGLLSSVDDRLGDLPDGYGESRIVILPRDPQWAYVYWDVPNSDKEELRRQGGQQLALRLYDVTDIDLNNQNPHSIQEYLCDDHSQEWYLPIPVSDRDYVLDIGYRCFDGRWLVLARSASVHIPPVYPSDWVEDIFVTVDSNQELQGNMVYDLVRPTHSQAIPGDNLVYDKILGMTQGVEAQRMAGSVFGSIQHVTGSVISPYIKQEMLNPYVYQEVVSSYVFPSSVGMWAIPTASGVNVSTMSGVGLAVRVSTPSEYPHKFWLVADAELIVYGATEPDATVTIGGRPIELNPDGTFRFQMSFQDGLIDYPIVAVAVDGEQTRSVHMKFNRETSECLTKAKEEAV